jgi:4-hydroxy-tetrahydrodipicolinate synthase
MVTPFRDDLELDRPGLRADADFLARSGVDVIVCLGSEGEFYALSDEERRVVAEEVVDAVGRRKPVVVGVSHPSSFVAAALADHARTIGADAVLATPPYFARADEQSIVDHFVRVADRGIPLFMYNSPGRTGVSMSRSLIVQAARRSGAVGVKQAAPDVSELADLLTADLADGFTVVGGAEVTFWPALAVGAAGNTATAASAVPETFVDLWRAARDGRADDARALYARLGTLRRAYAAAGGQAAVVKAMMSLVGLAGGPTRPPLRPLDASVLALVEEALAALRPRG